MEQALWRQFHSNFGVKITPLFLLCRYKTWTLNSGLDYGLDYGLDFGLDWTVSSVLALLFKAEYEC